MGKQRVRVAVAVGVAILAIVGVQSRLAANHSWGGYHWARTANPFTIKLGNNVSSAWTMHLSSASADWNQSTVLDTVVVPGSARPRNCRPTKGRVEVCDANYGNTGWLGVAQIWVSGLHITQGTVKLNDTYFNTAQYDTPSWRQLVTCQEIGHTFGLDHQDTNFDNPNLGTCMDYTSNPDGPPSNTSPNKHDYDELVTIYSHLDSSTTIGQSTGLPAAAAEAAEANWGRVVRANGRTAVFDLDLGGGHHVFTFVIWA